MSNIDFRYIRNGFTIPTEYYSDQPYFIKASDGAWVCTVTTGPGLEGQPGQHIINARSNDQGKTWSEPVALEPSDGPEASWSSLLMVDKRIYCFYMHNTDNIRFFNGDRHTFPDGKCRSVDHVGYFVYKFSDDNGVTWSKERYPIPMRLTDVDRKNPFNGKSRIGWCVGKPFIYENAAYVPYSKIGKYDNIGHTNDEGWLLRCPNISEKDCAKHKWETLPDGEYGLKTPAGGGPVAEEHSFTVLSDGSFYSVYRTIDGKPVEAYSRDGGHTWKTPQYKRYADGRLVRHPRAANFCWKCENGKYLYWYHNNGFCGYGAGVRNPVWISGGIEADSPEGKIILWSQGEILLYEDDPNIGMSYPDLLIDDGKYFVSETQKDIARVHEIPVSFIETLWKQFEIREICKDGLIGGNNEYGYVSPGKFKMPKLKPFLSRDPKISDHRSLDSHSGISLDLWIDFHHFEEGKPIFDTRDSNGAGIFIKIAEKSSIEITISDLRIKSIWTSDEGVFSAGMHHLGIIIDGGPKLIMLVTDGVLNDGAGKRVFGFGRYNPWISDVNGLEEAKLGCESIEVKNVRVYGRPIMVTEMIGNYRFGFI